MLKKFLPMILLALSVSSLHAQTRAYVTSEDARNVTVIDVATNTVVAVIPVGTRSFPLGVALTPDGTRAYVCNFFGGNVDIQGKNVGTQVGPNPVTITPCPAVAKPKVDESATGGGIFNHQLQFCAR